MIDGMPRAGLVPKYPWLAFWHAAMQIRIDGFVVAGFLVVATSQAQWNLATLIWLQFAAVVLSIKLSFFKEDYLPNRTVCTG